MNKKATLTVTAAACLVAAVVGVAGWTQPAVAQDVPPSRLEVPKTDMQSNLARMGQRLVDGLKNTDGCLGAEAVNLSPGRVAILGWFKDKQAALAWYNHPTHKAAMAAAGMNGNHAADDAKANDDPSQRMAHIPDGVPIFAVAAMSFTGPPANPGSEIPFSSISIELFAPLSGGLQVGEAGFSPKTFRDLVPGEQSIPDGQAEQQHDEHEEASPAKP